MSTDRRIYLDHAATTPLEERVYEAMKPYFLEKYGNASSIHSFGREARAAADQARETVAAFLGCESTEIIFTSGGSESDNLAIKGVIESFETQNSKVKIQNFNSKIKNDEILKQVQDDNNRTIEQFSNNAAKPHVVTSAFEHHAVLSTIEELEKAGRIEATYIKPDKDGILNLDDVEKAINSNTLLISIMYVNNEIGTVQPVREIGKMIEAENRNRENKIYFHTDAVQAAEYFPMDTKHLHVDLLTMSAHKIYGPKGVGLLFVRKGTPMKHQIIGGGQEYKLRAGTENVAGIVGFATAIKIIQEKKSGDSGKIKSLRDKLIDGLLKIPNSELNGDRELRSPANLNISFKNAEGESILLNLDLLGIAASSGSACTSGSLEPSHVLASIGCPPEKSHGSIRFTLGRKTTETEIDRVIEVMPGIIEKLRAMSPFK